MKRACSSTYAPHYSNAAYSLVQKSSVRPDQATRSLSSATGSKTAPSIVLHRPYQTRPCPPYTLTGQRRQVARLTNLLVSLVSNDQSLANWNRIYHEIILIILWFGMRIRITKLQSNHLPHPIAVEAYSTTFSSVSSSCGRIRVQRMSLLYISSTSSSWISAYGC